MSEYVYCFALTEQIGSLAGIVGAWEMEVKTLAQGSISAVISDLPDGFQVASDQTAALAHNRVVDAVLAQSTPVPCRFGNGMSRENLRTYMEANSIELLELLTRFANRVEMTVRVVSKTASKSTSAADLVVANSVLDDEMGKGTRFLRAKLLSAVAAKSKTEMIRKLIERLDAMYDDLIADKTNFVNPDGAGGWTAHLVAKSELARYRLRFGQAGPGPEDFVLSLSGPWAPYSFVSSSFLSAKPSRPLTGSRGLKS